MRPLIAPAGSRFHLGEGVRIPVASGVALLLVVGAIFKLTLTTGSAHGGDSRIEEAMLVLAGVARLAPILLRYLGWRANRTAPRGRPRVLGDERRRFVPFAGRDPGHDHPPDRDRQFSGGRRTRPRRGLRETGAIS